MYNVLIVDDEEPVLDSYAHMLSSREELKLCGKARTGYEAISVVHSAHPDIVLIDIGMPGIDGLDTISELQKTYHDILFIVSTAYERFDVAKRAIPLGIFRYLVKPVSKRTFFTTLDEAVEELEARREKVRTNTERLKKAAEVYHWEQKNFLSLLTWKTLGEEEWGEYKHRFGFTSDTALIAMVSVDGYEGASEAYDEILSKLKYTYQVFSAEFLGRLMLFFPGADSPDRVRQTLSDIITRLLPDTDSWSLGIGSLLPFNRLQSSCQEALSEVDTALFDVQELETEQTLLRRLRKSAGRSEHVEEALTEFERLSDHLLLRNPFEVAKGKLIMTFTLLLDDLASLLSNQIPYDFIREISALQNREEWFQWSRRMLSFIQERSQLYRNQNRPRALNKAIAFLDEHYSQQIQLADAAEECDLTPSYLSRLFSDHMDISFVDYLTSVRIQRAKHLMKTTDQPLKEISYAVGYQDPNYFSKLFRKHCGVSPSAFQKARGETDE